MSLINLKDATKQLAAAVEKSSPDELVEIYAELFPDLELPREDKTQGLAQQLADYIQKGIEPEEVVDLWNLVFPTWPNFYFDEEDRVLRQNERNHGYVGN